MSKWIIDSGATQHMTPHRQAFDTYEAISNCHVFLGDNGMVEAVGKGSILVEAQVKRRITIDDVLHLPKLHANLLLVSKLASMGLKVHFNVMRCIVTAQSREVLAMGSMEANLYQLELKKVNGAKVSTLAHTSVNATPWSFGTGDLAISMQRGSRHSKTW